MKFALDWIEEFLVSPPPADRVRALLDQAGLPAESIETVGTSTVLDVEITPNRPDAMSHRGIAREIAAMSGTPLAAVSARYAAPPSSGEPVESHASVVIQVPRL